MKLSVIRYFDTRYISNLPLPCTQHNTTALTNLFHIPSTGSVTHAQSLFSENQDFHTTYRFTILSSKPENTGTGRHPASSIQIFEYHINTIVS